MEHKMHDMGQMRRVPNIAEPKVDETKEKSYPNVSFNEDQMPFLKGKKLGDTFKAVVEFTVTGSRDPYDFSDSKTPEYELKLKKCSEYEA